MLRLIRCSESYKNNFVFKDFFPNRSRNLLVISHNLFEEDGIDAANNLILENLLKIELEDLDETTMQDFFSEMFIQLNWQLSSKFKELNSHDKGVSLVFMLQMNDNIYIYQFGRMLLGIYKKKKFSLIGRSWENFKIKSRRELFLLGGQEENIKVKVIQLQLKKGEYLFSVPSNRINDFEAKKPQAKLLNDIMNEMSEEENFPQFLLGNVAEKKKKRFLGIFGRKK